MNVLNAAKAMSADHAEVAFPAAGVVRVGVGFKAGAASRAGNSSSAGSASRAGAAPLAGSVFNAGAAARSLAAAALVIALAVAVLLLPQTAFAANHSGNSAAFIAASSTDVSSYLGAFEGEYESGNYALVTKILSSSYAAANYKATGAANAKGFEGYSRYYPAIAKKADALVSGLKGNRAKARALYLWVVNNIAYYQSPEYWGLPDQPSANPFLAWRDRKAVCYGYAQLTQLMFQRAGVPCVLLRGYLRSTPSVSHVWNAAYIDGAWRYVDATTGASGKDSGSEAHETISNHFFLMSDDAAAERYKASFIECCMGDVCYWPVIVDETTVRGVKLNANGGTSPTSRIALNKNPRLNGEKYRLLPEPTRKGAEFLGWFTARKGGKHISEQNALTPKPGSTLYAHWKVLPQENPLVVTKKASVVAVRYNAKRPIVVSLKRVFVVKGAQGKVAFRNASAGRAGKTFKVSATEGKLSIPKGVKRGTYSAKVQVTAKGNARYKAKSKTVAFMVKVV